MSRDPQVFSLLEKYFTPEDYFLVYSRMPGMGGVGGKACGMLVARTIIEQMERKDVASMETNHSFYPGSDAFIHKQIIFYHNIPIFDYLFPFLFFPILFILPQSTPVFPLLPTQ